MILIIVLGPRLDDYLAWNENLGTWRCLMCQREFSQKSSASRHFRVVHCPNERQQCHLCFLWSKNQISLQQHMRDSHRKGLTLKH